MTGWPPPAQTFVAEVGLRGHKIQENEGGCRAGRNLAIWGETWKSVVVLTNSMTDPFQDNQNPMANFTAQRLTPSFCYLF